VDESHGARIHPQGRGHGSLDPGRAAILGCVVDDRIDGGVSVLPAWNVADRIFLHDYLGHRLEGVGGCRPLAVFFHEFCEGHLPELVELTLPTEDLPSPTIPVQSVGRSGDHPTATQFFSALAYASGFYNSGQKPVKINSHAPRATRP